MSTSLSMTYTYTQRDMEARASKHREDEETIRRRALTDEELMKEMKQKKEREAAERAANGEEVRCMCSVCVCVYHDIYVNVCVYRILQEDDGSGRSKSRKSGGFFSDDISQNFQHYDFSARTGAYNPGDENLPESMKGKNLHKIGLRGQTRYKGLKHEDTSERHRDSIRGQYSSSSSHSRKKK
jgi:hypothetical protein